MKAFIAFLFLVNLIPAMAGIDFPRGLKDFKGESLDLEGKHYKVLVFSNRTCPCTMENFPYISELAKEYKNVSFYAVHSLKTSTESQMQEMTDKFDLKFPMIDDKTLVLANLLRANRTPQVFVLNEKNEILYSGGVTNRTFPKSADKHYLRDTLEEIKLGKKITNSETRTLGCAIVR